MGRPATSFIYYPVGTQIIGRQTADVKGDASGMAGLGAICGPVS
jgi:hypothetical protein